MNMYFKMIKPVLTMLTILPLPAVSLAAESRLTDLENELALDLALDNDRFSYAKPNSLSFRTTEGMAQEDRSLLRSILPRFTPNSSIAAALRRFASMNPSLSSTELSVGFQETIELLQEKGLISSSQNGINGPISS
jgi:hypothetical protein